MAFLCLTLTKPTLEENLKIINKHKPDLAELRLDHLDFSSFSSDFAEIQSFSNSCCCPLILTCRLKEDGGQWPDSKPRYNLFQKALKGNFNFIDIEIDTHGEPELNEIIEEAKERGVKIIRSFHNFDCVPSSLEEDLLKMKERGDLVKAAVMPKGIKDLRTLFEIGQRWTGRLDSGESSLILLGMGAFGVPSRILATVMNSFLTFCSDSLSQAAPGHLDIITMREVYHIDKVNSQSKIFGIIGNPVLHSQSPQIHNRGFASKQINSVYIPFTVDSLKEFFNLASFLDIRGFSVTVPFKKEIIPYLETVSEEVRTVGACNTVFKKDGKFYGENTDILGFINPLERQSYIQLKPQGLKGLKVGLIGAGGAARSALFALLKKGCHVEIFNRTLSNATQLALEFSSLGEVEGFSLQELHQRLPFDILVQTTAVGMEGFQEHKDPSGGLDLKGVSLVYDIIYTPEETVLLKRARNSSCFILGGRGMLEEQAKAQFSIFLKCFS